MDYFDRSGNGGRSDPVFTGDGGGRATAPFVMVSAEEAALRNGNGFTVSTGLMTIAVGNVGGLMIANPVGSGKRIFITSRLFTCNLPSNVAATSFASMSNPTGNTPPTVTTPTNRTFGGKSVATVMTGVTTGVPTGGNLGPGNILAGGQVNLQFQRTLEPGQSFENWIVGAATGLTGNNDAMGVITFAFHEEQITG